MYCLWTDPPAVSSDNIHACDGAVKESASIQMVHICSSEAQRQEPLHELSVSLSKEGLANRLRRVEGDPVLVHKFPKSYYPLVTITRLPPLTITPLVSPQFNCMDQSTGSLKVRSLKPYLMSYKRNPRVINIFARYPMAVYCISTYMWCMLSTRLWINALTMMCSSVSPPNVITSRCVVTSSASI